MQSILDIKNFDYLHHFYLIKSSALDLTNIKKHFQKNFDYDFEFLEFNFDNLSAEQARELVELNNRKINPTKKILFFVKSNNINVQAQNILLKSLEEPTFGLHFFFILPDISNILATVTSRAHIIDEQTKTFSKELVDYFLKLNLTERIKYVEKISDELKDSKKNKQEILDFVDALIYNLNCDENFKVKEYKTFSEILNIRDFISDNGSSVKTILESIVLALPLK